MPAKKRTTLSLPTKVRFGKQPVPKQLFNTLKYAELVTINLGAGGEGYYTFCCNGMYDPNITGTGHQPLYFDQLSAIYDHYTVLSSKIKVTPFTVSAGYPVVISLWQDDDSSPTIAAYSTAIERPGSYSTVVDLARNTANPMFSYWDARKTFGGDPQAQDSLQGSASANPSETTNWMIYANGTLVLASGSITVLVEIEYNAVWDELTSIAGS